MKYKITLFFACDLSGLCENQLKATPSLDDVVCDGRRDVYLYPSHFPNVFISSMTVP